jgi:hypothetical protein
MEFLDGLGGEVVEVFVRALCVEPQHPLRGRDFDLVDVAPRPLPADEFILERPDGGLGQGVSRASPTDPTEGSTPSSMSRCVNATDVYWLPASLCAISPRMLVWPAWARVKNACSRASRTRVVVIDLAARQPKIRRL